MPGYPNQPKKPKNTPNNTPKAVSVPLNREKKAELERNAKSIEEKEIKKNEELLKAEKQKEETARQAKLKEISVPPTLYAALKATGPDLSTDTTHKYLKKGWFGQAFDVAESKFQRLREATFGSLITPKETYEHRIMRDHSMVAIYEARFNDIKNSYTQALEVIAGKTYPEIKDEARQNTDQNPAIKELLKKINIVDEVLNQIQTQGQVNEITNPDTQEITETFKPGYMERVGVKNFKTLAKQDAKILSHNFYKLLDICENELLKLADYEKAQMVSKLASPINALVEFNNKNKEQSETTQEQNQEIMNQNEEEIDFTSEEISLMKLFQDSDEFRVKSVGLSADGGVPFIFVTSLNGKREKQIIFNNRFEKVENSNEVINKLSEQDKQTLLKIREAIEVKKQIVEYKNFNLDYTNTTSTPLIPEPVIPNIKPNVQPIINNSSNPTENNVNNLFNQEQNNTTKEKIENGDFDNLVASYFQDFQPAELIKMKANKDNNIAFDILVNQELLSGFKPPVYIQIRTEDIKNPEDFDKLNKLGLLSQDKNLRITLNKGLIDVEVIQNEESNLTSTVTTINNNSIENEKLVELEAQSLQTINTTQIQNPGYQVISEAPIITPVTFEKPEPTQSSVNSRAEKSENFERIPSTGDNINQVLSNIFNEYPNLVITGINKDNPHLLNVKGIKGKFKIDLGSDSKVLEYKEVLDFKKTLENYQNDNINSEDFVSIQEQFNNEKFAKHLVEDIKSNMMLKKFFQGTFGDDKIKPNMVLNLKIDSLTKNVTLLSHKRDDEAKTKLLLFSAKQSFFDPLQLELIKKLSELQFSFIVVGGEVFIKDNKDRTVFNIKAKESKDHKTAVTHEPIFTLE